MVGTNSFCFARARYASSVVGVVPLLEVSIANVHATDLSVTGNRLHLSRSSSIRMSFEGRVEDMLQRTGMTAFTTKWSHQGSSKGHQDCHALG